MPLSAISAPPAFIRPDLDEPAQQSTPATFVGLPPTLRTLLEGATALLKPGLPDATTSSTGATTAAPSEAWQAQGTLYVTNDAVSFLDSTSSKGFTVDFPTISLHAVSRSIPDALKHLADASGSTACLYCQLDDSAGQDDTAAAEGGEAVFGSGAAHADADTSAMDDSEDGGNGEDEEEEVELRELWLLPQQPDQLDPLFEMLSYCASLHPSIGTEDDTGHPFAGLGAFGTGAPGMLGVGGPVLDLSALSEQGVFDDAMEDSTAASSAGPNGAGVGQEAANGHGNGPADGLSDTGRAVLARLESSIEWPPGMQPTASETSSTGAAAPATGSGLKDASCSGTTPKAEPKPSRVSNTLILTALPESLFEQPELLSSLLDLLHAYGPLQSWTPLPSMGRALVVFEDGILGPSAPSEEILTPGQESAKRAKVALDRLLWGFEDDGADKSAAGEAGIDDEEEMEWPPRKAEGKEARNGASMRVYFGPPSSVLLASDSEDALAVPSTDKNFLISPPGSPPVGWEPIKEDPPNRDTLAWDLIKALGELRDQGGAVDSWTTAPLREEGNDDGGEGEERVNPGSPMEADSNSGLNGSPTLPARSRGHARKGSLGPPSLVIPPSEAKVSRKQAASMGSTQPRPTPFMHRVEAETRDTSGDTDENSAARVRTDPTAAAAAAAAEEEESVVISLPGVTVQAFEDGEEDAEAARRRALRQPRTGMSISSVKATVESMLSGASGASAVPEAGGGGAPPVERLAGLRLGDGASASGGLRPGLGAGVGAEELGEGGGKRITPTGRPPLA